MSFSAWEQDALDSIKSGLTDSDPALAAQLMMFTRLASGEDMPVWLVTTLTLVAAALAISRGDGPRTCAGTFVTLCGGASAAPQPAQPIP